MSTARRGATPTPAAEPGLDVDNWRDDWDSLRGYEEEISSDKELAEALFGSVREAFELGWYLGTTQTAEAEAAQADGSGERRDWGPISLYGKEPSARRILFLELIAGAVLRLESFPTKKEAVAFMGELTASREEHWGEHPWAYASKGNAAYLNHVRGLADVFANATIIDPSSPTAEDVAYRNRQRQPFGG